MPVPGNGKARFQPIHVDDVARIVVASLGDPLTIGESFAVGGPRYWTYREITAEVVSALGKRRAIVPMPVALIRLVAGTSEFLHLPFPVATDQLRQLKRDNIGPLGLIPSRFGFEPRPMEGALGYLRTRLRDQVAGNPPMNRAKGLAGGLVWLVLVLVFALGAAGLVSAMDARQAARPERPDRGR